MTRHSPATATRPVASEPAQGDRAHDKIAVHPALTTRQADIIELATQGLTNSQIAERMQMSTYAIKFNLSAAYRKLEVANRTQAAVAYLSLRGEDRL